MQLTRPHHRPRQQKLDRAGAEQSSPDLYRPGRGVETVSFQGPTSGPWHLRTCGESRVPALSLCRPSQRCNLVVHAVRYGLAGEAPAKQGRIDDRRPRRCWSIARQANSGCRGHSQEAQPVCLCTAGFFGRMFDVLTDSQPLAGKKSITSRQALLVSLGGRVGGGNITGGLSRFRWVALVPFSGRGPWLIWAWQLRLPSALWRRYSSGSTVMAPSGEGLRTTAPEVLESASNG